MDPEKKIAWTNAGFIVCGFWAVSFGLIFAYSLIAIGYSGAAPDALGVGLTIGMAIIFIILPAFLAWKCFKIAHRLSGERRENFVHKDAFE